MKAFRVVVHKDDEDEATAILWEKGTVGIEVQPRPGSAVALLAYFADETDLLALESGLRSIGTAQITQEAVPMVDWVARFREGFRTFRAGSFEVVPAWDAEGSSAAANPRRLVVDPGRAFGTGTHESTRLCLGAIDDARRPLGRVIDIGTGTGLLAVAAARRGAGLVAAVDNDPEAVASARRHADLNAVCLLVVLGDGARPFRDSAFDLVLANLMAPLLIERRHELASLLAPAGTLVLSGLLRSDLPEVAAAYEHLGRPDLTTEGEWAALTFRSKAA